MHIFRDISIGRKLIIIIMITSAIALSLACGAFVLNDLTVQRKAMASELSILAEVIGNSSTAAITFDDRKTAREALESLRAHPHIVSASIYDKNSGLFAMYLRNDIDSPSFPARPKTDGHLFESGKLKLFKQIKLDNEIIGTVFLCSDLEALNARFKRYAWITAIIMLASFLTALFLSWKLQKVVSKPILDLAKTAEIISKRKNYSIRAKKHTQDELGTLIDGFNEMLAQIQDRDNKLEKHRNHLEKMVLERTAELQESEKKYRTLAEESPISIMAFDDRGVITFVNKYHLKTFAKKKHGPDFFLGKKITELPDITRAGITSKFEGIFKGETVTLEEIFFPEFTGGHSGYQSIKAVSLFAEDELDGGILLREDITERVMAQKALSESELQLRTLINSMPDIVCFKDGEGRWLEANKAGLKLFQLEDVNYKGKKGSELAALTHPVFQDTFLTCKKTDEIAWKTGSLFRGEETIPLPDGRDIIFDIVKAPLFTKDGKRKGLIVLGRDVTEQKKMEKELLTTRKLESIGILAGGIAHDFNNFLTAILGNVSLAKMFVKPQDKAFKNLEGAERACIRAKDLTQQLLTFSKGGAPVKKAASIGEIIQDSATFVLSGSNVKCEFHVPDDLWPVEVDEGQMYQVINNVIINADQAMPEGGIISIRAENITIGAKEALPLKEGRYVRIKIEDQGIGIPMEHLDKIFDPYFSTKSKGSGLGLASSYSIIKNHDGLITAGSETGVGTTFTIYLPATSKEIDQEREKAIERVADKDRILVMDDEELVRDITGEMLKALGFEPILASDGSEAIRLYQKAKESSKPFDIVIMDLTIPGRMGGKEAIKKLLEIDPAAKVLVSSGYANDPVMAEYKKYGFKGVIPKPYKIEEMKRAIHELLCK